MSFLNRYPVIIPLMMATAGSITVIVVLICIVVGVPASPVRQTMPLPLPLHGSSKKISEKSQIQMKKDDFSRPSRPSRPRALAGAPSGTHVSPPPPEVRRLTELLEALILSAEGQGDIKWDILIGIGDIYQKGGFPRFLPDTTSACECYQIAAACPDGRIAGMAQMKFMEARLSPIAIEDHAGRALPRAFCVEACALAGRALRDTFKTKYHTFERPFYPLRSNMAASAVGDATHPVGGDRERDREEDHIRIQRQRQGEPLEDAGNWNMRRERRDNPIPAFMFDSQNVHDHGVASATQRNLSRILKENENENDEKDEKERKTTHKKTNNKGKENDGEKPARRRRGKEDEEIEILGEISKEIQDLSDIDNDTATDALRLLDNLDGQHVHSVHGTTEKQALIAVWKKIKSSDNRENLIETLAKQLASGIEHGVPVCSSGKIARIVSVMDGTSNETRAAPMWIIKDEIGSLAAKVREDFRDASEEKQKQEFRKRAYRDYVETLGMNKAIIGSIIDTYSEGF